MTYSPGHDSASAVTRTFAASRVCAASTIRGLPSPCNLRMQKGRPNQTPSGGTILQGAVRPLSHQFGVPETVCHAPLPVVSFSHHYDVLGKRLVLNSTDGENHFLSRFENVTINN